MSELIRADGVYKSFQVNGGTVEVLKGVDLRIGKGEFIAIVGPSGAGKSTFLHLLGALDRPTAGEIVYEQTSLARMDDGQLAAFRNRTVGFIFQFHHLLPEFTALENVMMPLLVARRTRLEARQIAASLLKEVGLEHRHVHRPSELSGGEQQRVAIARALGASPKVVLADEPTGNLDTKTGDATFELLHRLNRERGLTFVMVTHNEKLAHRSDRIVTILDGRIVEGA
ncbi:MAG: lipoprotein-releasing system ATP-binding protein LolD [Candidatus Methylomirabilota bacterium]|nr:MAG: lipoprotein-releasing system ATP-binding protein LolD [candidate division NC10 bacterium]